jgi:hypothetical protein
MRQASGGDGRFAPTPGGCSLDAVRGYHATLTSKDIICRTILLDTLDEKRLGFSS